ncbi:tetratricopeptide repeat protein [Zobellia nedashkovskayae]
MNIGVIQKNNNDFFGSKETLTDALRFLKAPDKIANCYNTLATNHRKLLNYSDAVGYYQKAIKITESVKDRIIYENNLAASYIDNKEFQKAIVLLQKIERDSTATANQKEYARIQDNLAYAKWLSGLSIESYEFEEPLKLRVEKKG